MKRFLPHIALTLFVILGLALLIQMAIRPAIPKGWTVVSGDADLRWNPMTEKLTVVQHSRYLMLEMGTRDLNQLILKQSIPKSQVLIKVDDGNPTRILGKLPSSGSIILINPNGIIVGPDGTLDVRALNVFSTLDITDQEHLNGSPLFDSSSLRSDDETSGTIGASGEILIGVPGEDVFHLLPDESPAKK